MRSLNIRWWRRGAAGLAVVAMTALGLGAALPASAAPAPTTVTVTGGTAHWNFVDSWLDYIAMFNGTIDPEPGKDGSEFGPATGTYDPTTGALDVSFGGSVTYTVPAHGVEITFDDVAIAVDDGQGTITAAVSGNDGSVQKSGTYELATFDASGDALVATDGALKATGLATTISSDVADGVSAFDRYQNKPGAELNLALTLAEPAAWNPQINVSQTTGLDPAGQDITVTGTGFDPDANTGKYPPLAGQPAGVYVILGKFAPTWQPSQGVDSSARTVIDQRWAIPGDADSLPDRLGSNPQYVPLTDDGGFTATLTAKTTDEGPKDGVYGVYVYPASGAQNADQELTVPITFATETTPSPTTTSETTTAEPTTESPAPTTTTTEPTGTTSTPVPTTTSPSPSSPAATGPAVTVTPDTLDPSVENTVTVKGTGFTGAGAANGVYVLLGKKSIWQGNGPLVADGWVTQGWVQPDQVTKGAFETTLTVPAGALKAGVAYQVATSAAHGLAFTDRSLDTFTPLTVAKSETTTAEPTTTGPTTESPAPTTSTSTASPTVSIKGGTSATVGQTMVITGSGFTAGEPVTATVQSTPVTIGTEDADANGDVEFTWTVPADFETGDHTVTLAADSGSETLAFTVAAAETTTAESTSDSTSATPQVQCTTEIVPATSGTPHLTWGVKSSFVGYVESGVANGTVTTAGGAARTGNGFTWGTGSGTLSDSGTGTLSFPGSVHFTGHQGVLNVTISDVRVKVTGSNSGVLIVDVDSTDMQGNDVSGSDVTFADLSFSSWSATGGTASATLTSAGAQSFAGFYNAGEALDPVSVSITGATTASTVQRCTDASGDIVDSDGNPVEQLASTGVAGESMTALAAALAAAGALMLLAMRRRSRSAPRH